MSLRLISPRLEDGRGRERRPPASFTGPIEGYRPLNIGIYQEFKLRPPRNTDHVPLTNLINRIY